MNVIVIGGGAAGMSAASRIKRAKPDWRVTVFERSWMVSHAPCGIPYLLSDKTKEVKELMYYTPDYFREKRGIDVRVNAEVKKVDLRRRLVIVKEEGVEREYRFDKLVIATGAKAKRGPGVPIRHPANAGKLKEIVEGAKRIAVVGGGITGVEVASELREAGKEVYLFQRSRLLRKNFDPEFSEIVERKLKEMGVNVIHEEVIEGDERNVRTRERAYSFDVVISAIGYEPEVELVKDQLRLGPHGAIDVNEYLETSEPGVFAAGDAAEHWMAHTGVRVWCPLAPTANKMGLVAGLNVVGKGLRFPGTLCSALLKVGDLELGRSGHTEDNLKELGFNYEKSFVKSRNKAHYYPGGSEVWVKMMASDKILGVQVAGREIRGRLDAASVAMFAKMSPRELFFSDIAYAPPFGPVWDPIIVAARLLADLR